MAVIISMAATSTVGSMSELRRMRSMMESKMESMLKSFSRNRSVVRSKLVSNRMTKKRRRNLKGRLMSSTDNRLMS
jgi:hypothetical protein